MKKLLLSLSFFLLAVPSFAFAGGEQYGVYIAPKVMLGVTQGDVNMYITEAGFPEYAAGQSKSINKAVFGGALAVGYDFYTKLNIPLRAELEYGFFGNANKSYNQASIYTDGGITTNELVRYKSKLSLQSLMVNMYFDWHNSSNFTPYISAGAGLGFVGLKVNQSVEVQELGVSEFYNINFSSKRKTNFAWSIGLGCAYDFNDNISLDAGYRYAQFGKAQSQPQYDDGFSELVSARAKTKTISMHQFMVGVRFTF